MSEVLPELGLVLVLVVINAAFAGGTSTEPVLGHHPDRDHAGRLPGVGRCCSLGRIPSSPGDVIDIDDWHLEVMGLHRRTITEIRLRRIAHQGPGGGASGATTSDTHRQETDR